MWVKGFRMTVEKALTNGPRPPEGGIHKIHKTNQKRVYKKVLFRKIIKKWLMLFKGHFFISYSGPEFYHFFIDLLHWSSLNLSLTSLYTMNCNFSKLLPTIKIWNYKCARVDYQQNRIHIVNISWLKPLLFMKEHLGQMGYINTRSVKGLV